MKFLLGCLLLAAITAAQEVRDEDRGCPDGFFYAGEVTPAPENSTGRGMTATQGPRSQVYSCYSVHRGPFDWVNASKKCAKDDGQLLSVNNFGEWSVLTGKKFLIAAFGEGGETEARNVITSGISLALGQWTWFGAGDSDSAGVNETITSGITNVASNSTSCLAVSFNNVTDAATNTTSLELVYTAMPCLSNFTMAICEVRVYEQIWYVWFTTNWLQILFLMTLVMLLVSSCVTFQIWVSRPSRRARTSRTSLPGHELPPAYSIREEPAQQTAKAKLAAAAEKYTEKGKDIMAKVVFYRKPEDKQRLATDA